MGEVDRVADGEELEALVEPLEGDDDELGAVV